MHPVLFRIGPLAIYSYSAALVTAFLVGTLLAYREAPRLGIDPENVLDLAILIGITSILGARVTYVLLYGGSLWTIFSRGEGLAFHGGLVGGFLIAFWYVRRKKMPVGVTADLAAPSVALGYAITRIGCLMYGCCYGKVSDLPWALPSSFVDSLPRHPTQLYAFFSSLLIFGILRYLKPRKAFDGYLFVVYVGLYGLYRFIVEFYREGLPTLGFLSLGQVVSLGMIGAAALLVRFWPWKSGDKTSHPGEGTGRGNGNT